MEKFGPVVYAVLCKASNENEVEISAETDKKCAHKGTGFVKFKEQEAADQLLYIIAADKEWEDDGARKQLVKFFEEAGPMDPFTITARRKLSSLLFC